MLTFADNGLGIDVQQHVHRFFGIYSSFTFIPKAKGSVCTWKKTQAVAINAKIEFQSKEGEGSVFTVLLPVKLPTYP
jgi:sensor histidine kinase regulating citrate/malate metabolism